MNSFRIFTSILLLAAAPALQAGPIRDAIKEKLLERQAARATAQADEGRHDMDSGTVQRNQSYGADPKETLDVYLPPGNHGGAPVIFMVHGGAWKIGDKSHGKVVENKLARWQPKGFVFISVNYPMLPQADPLKQADAVAQALSYAQAHAGQWGGDPNKFILMGHSAGAHLVSLLSADPGRAFAQGARPWLGTVSLDSAAMDVAQIMEARHFGFYDEAFGKDPAYWRQASPLQQLTSKAPPMLMVCSSRRADSCLQAEGFAHKAHSLGLQARVLPEDLSHGEINDKLGLAGAYTDQVEAFLASLDDTVAAQLNSQASGHPGSQLGSH